MKRLILLCIVGLSTHAIGAPCVDPALHGAIPDDALSDSAAIQAAIDLVTAADGGTVCIGPGRWVLTRAPVGSYNRQSAINTHGHKVTIAGAGQADTVLAQTGDMGGGSINVLSIDPGAERTLIRDLTIDGTGATNTEEQNHLIGTSTLCPVAACAPIVDIDIQNVTFLQQRPAPPGRTGDFIRLLGQTPAVAVRGVRLVGLTFRGSARSAIGLQRNVHDVLISSSLFSAAVDQDIDSEPTGGLADGNSGIAITGNIFRTVAGSQGDYAITIGGASPENPMTGVTISGNVLQGRGISLYRSKDVVISGNVAIASMTGAGAVIQARHVCSGLNINGNTLARSGAPGPMVSLAASVGFCQRAAVVGNQMEQGTPGSGVWTESVGDLSVVGNAMTWTTASPSAAAVYVRANARPVDGVLVSANRIRGAGVAVFLSSSPHPVSNLSITGNMADSTTGLSCGGAGGFGRITSSGNSIGPRACSAVIGAGD